jgi:hypothetical protein
MPMAPAAAVSIERAPAPPRHTLPASPPEFSPRETADARFVRAASFETGPNGSRLSLLMDDDRLGRIALRMIDRAGLIQAVVRTEDTATTQALQDSLPQLLESLSHKGMAASWHAGGDDGRAYSNGEGQPGQGRRWRGGPVARHRKTPQAVFRLETS